ncbi:MAG TPA: hypothetical protein VFR87_01640 [Nocardioidaceae bacterium]|nr:hypothetical protein [Nocardioidaceae bacterium]
MGMVAPTLVDVVLRRVGLSDAGAASGLLNTALQLGGAVCAAVLGYIFFRQQPIPLPVTGGTDLSGMRGVLVALIVGYTASLVLAATLLPGREKAGPTAATM